jgi:HK97 family phage prohead protease
MTIPNTTIIRKITDAGVKGNSKYVLSTEDPDHYLDVIVQKGWVLKTFLANSVALWSHDKLFVVGRWLRPRIENNCLVADLELAPESTSDRVGEIVRLVKAGFIKAVSVGFRPIESEPITKTGGTRFIRSELVECSLVAIGANPNALIAAKALGISNATLKMVFKQGNSNSSLADRIAEAKRAVKSRFDDPEEQQRIHRKALETLARLNAAKPAEKPADKPADKRRTPEEEVARARASLAKAKAMLARAEAEGYVPLQSEDERTYVTWRGEKIPIPKWRGEDIW